MEDLLSSTDSEGLFFLLSLAAAAAAAAGVQGFSV